MLALQTPYRVVYDIQQSGFQQWKTLLPVVALVSVMLVFAMKLKQSGKGTSILRIRLIQVVFILMWFLTIFAVYGNYSHYADLCQQVRAGSFTSAEGRITSFVPMSDSSRGTESFDVSDKHFHYSKYDLTKSYYGGSLREGLQVRIGYIGNDIVRVEVADTP